MAKKGGKPRRRVGGTTTGERLKRRRRVYETLVKSAGSPSSLDVQALAKELKVDKSTVYRDLENFRDDVRENLADKDAIEWVVEIETMFKHTLKEVLLLYEEAAKLKDKERAILVRRWLLQDITRIIDDRIRIGQAVGVIPKAADKKDIGINVDVHAKLESFFIGILGEVSESERDRLQGVLAGRLAALDAGSGALGARPSPKSDGTSEAS